MQVWAASWLCYQVRQSWQRRDTLASKVARRERRMHGCIFAGIFAGIDCVVQINDGIGGGLGRDESRRARHWSGQKERKGGRHHKFALFCTTACIYGNHGGICGLPLFAAVCIGRSDASLCKPVWPENKPRAEDLWIRAWRRTGSPVVATLSLSQYRRR